MASQTLKEKVLQSVNKLEDDSILQSHSMFTANLIFVY